MGYPKRKGFRETYFSDETGEGMQPASVFPAKEGSKTTPARNQVTSAACTNPQVASKPGHEAVWPFHAELRIQT